MQQQWCSGSQSGRDNHDEQPHYDNCADRWQYGVVKGLARTSAIATRRGRELRAAAYAAQGH
jgi:hypothetical protein